MVNVLVIAAHPDDEVLGCGGTLLKHKAVGDKIFACIVTTTDTPEGMLPRYPDYKERRQEALKVAKAIGFEKEPFFLNIPPINLDTYPHGALNDKLKAVVDEVKPSIIYSHHFGDPHKDHQRIYESVMVITRPSPGSPVREVYSMEPVSASEWSDPNRAPFTPQMYVDISNFLKRKLELMSIYKIELKHPPHPRSLESIETQARWRGFAIGRKAAEAFMIIRQIRD